MRNKTLTSKWSFINDLLHLIYPEVCLICDLEIASSEGHVCSFCSEQIAYTDFHLYEEDTEMDKLFWGRAEVFSTYGHLYFKKNAASQKILFNLKYKDGSRLGQHFGREIGERLLSMDSFKSCDLIIPIPLHHKKAFIRGYNQSEKIAEGISDVISVPVKNRYTKRLSHSATQTKKNRFQRWDNVSGIFGVSPEIKRFKHITVIDDVITTGSTIESFIISIRKVAPDIRISVVTLAIA